MCYMATMAAGTIEYSYLWCRCRIALVTEIRTAEDQYLDNGQWNCAGCSSRFALRSLRLGSSEPALTRRQGCLLLKFQDFDHEERHHEWLALWEDGTISFFRRSRSRRLYLESQGSYTLRPGEINVPLDKVVPVGMWHFHRGVDQEAYQRCCSTDDPSLKESQ